MGVNKVVLGNRTLIDLTAVTVTPAVLLDGYTAYDASGNLITGTYGAVSNLLTMNDGLINQRLSAKGVVQASGGTGYFVCDYFDFDYTKKTGLRIVNGNANIGNLGSNAYGSCRMSAYDANKSHLATWYISRRSNGTEGKWTTIGDDLIKSDLATECGSTVISDWTTVKYIRMCLVINNSTSSALSSVDDVLNSGIEIKYE